MTTHETFVDRIPEHWGRMAFGGVVAGLAAGFLLYRLGQHDAATLMLKATCCLLIALPIVNVIVVLVEEIRRRDWTFVLLAVGVLALIAFTIATKI